MAYEYEELILHDVKPLTNPGPPFRYEAMKELQEVYRKAKAWEDLKEVLMEEYPEVAHLADVSNGDGERGLLVKHEDILYYMDKLDGTNEFSNLLSDLEDKQND